MCGRDSSGRERKVEAALGKKVMERAPERVAVGQITLTGDHWGK